VRWDAQSRSNRGLSYGEALRRHALHVSLGLIWGAVILECAPSFIWWIMPVLAGLLLSVFVAVWTSGPKLGPLLRRWGLLLTPEETQMPRELAAVHFGPRLTLDGAPEPTTRVPAPAPLRMEPPSSVSVAPCASIEPLAQVAPAAGVLVPPADSVRIP
jgi:hypothetical protein